MPNEFETVRRMLQSLCDESFYAVRVKLAGVASGDASNWDAETNATFSNIVAHQEFQMECVCSDADVPTVRLKNLKGYDLASLLLAEKFVVLDGSTLAAVRPSVSQSFRQRVSQKQSVSAPLAIGTFNACTTGKTAASMGKWPPATLQRAAPRESRATAQSSSTSSI